MNSDNFVLTGVVVLQMLSKGMVQVDNVTYRIEKRSNGEYYVYRILDDVKVGKFKSISQKLVVYATNIETSQLWKIVQSAVRYAKVSYHGRLLLT